MDWRISIILDTVMKGKGLSQVAKYMKEMQKAGVPLQTVVKNISAEMEKAGMKSPKGLKNYKSNWLGATNAINSALTKQGKNLEQMGVGQAWSKDIEKSAAEAQKKLGAAMAGDITSKRADEEKKGGQMAGDINAANATQEKSLKLAQKRHRLALTTAAGSKKRATGFRMENLSFLFMGMQIQRTMSGAMNASRKYTSTLEKNNRELGRMVDKSQVMKKWLELTHGIMSRLGGEGIALLNALGSVAMMLA